MTKDDRLYGLEHQEVLSESIEECVQDCEQFPVTVYVFKRTDVSGYAKHIASAAVEHALEMLDEEHADPGGDYTEPTEKMLAAARAFADVIVAEYVPWACERTGETITVWKGDDV